MDPLADELISNDLQFAGEVKLVTSRRQTGQSVPSRSLNTYICVRLNFVPSVCHREGTLNRVIFDFKFNHACIRSGCIYKFASKRYDAWFTP